MTLQRRLTHAAASIPVVGHALSERLVGARHRADERVIALADDGHPVALHRIRPEGETKGRPVILCHGIACNRYFFDHHPERSFARSLAREGRDVWILEMRGHGHSRRASRVETILRHQWQFDDYVMGDLPAAIRTVQERTGADRVDWIGHSMGGMVMYAYLMTHPGEDVGTVVALGSPTFIDNRFWFWQVAAAIQPFTRFIPNYPVRFIAWAAAPFILALHPFIPNPFYTSGNMRARDAARLFQNVLDDVSNEEFRVGATFIRRKGFRSPSLKLNYAASFDRVRRPLLVVAAAHDVLAPPRDVYAAYDRSASADKRYVNLGRREGYSADYGHVDLVMGKRALEEVLPIVTEWLQRHDPR
ncbi:MAG: alpha/beta fold hydrolase [Deltaproteobacteria bacterium]|nr:alpha/beta fold hydrolase [Deltaproteobacteria bacterium]